jgi:hypothetical protein
VCVFVFVFVCVCVCVCVCIPNQQAHGRESCRYFHSNVTFSNVNKIFKHFSVHPEHNSGGEFVRLTLRPLPPSPQEAYWYLFPLGVGGIISIEKKKKTSWPYRDYFDLSTRLRWMISFKPRQIYSIGNHPRYSLDGRLGGSRASVTLWKGEKPVTAWNRTSIVQPVTRRFTNWALILTWSILFNRTKLGSWWNGLTVTWASKILVETRNA